MFKKSLMLLSGMIGLAFGLLSVAVAPDATAADPYPSYSAKFVCGPLREDGDVVRGMYASTINIQNPQLKEVTFTKQAVIALPERDAEAGKFGAPSREKGEKLAPGQAMGVDCKDIRLLFDKTVDLPGHIEGFLVISVPSAKTDVLNVVGKYSARQIRGKCYHRHHDDDDDDHKGHHHGHHKCKPHKHDDDDDDGPGHLGKHRFWLGWGPDVETLDVEEISVKYVLPVAVSEP